MKDIPGEAILFDMYYMAKDPVPMASEKRELPKVEMRPADETTPQFRNFNISNVYVNGAQKAIFMRGLPEMHVKGINIENAIFQSKEGVDIQEAGNIRLNNIKVYSKETNPVIDITNSNNINISGFDYSDNADLLLRVSGDRSKAIQIKNTKYDHAKQKASTELGANAGQVKVD